MNIILVCLITYNAAWFPGFDLRHDRVLVRSGAQCDQIAPEYSRSAIGRIAYSGRKDDVGLAVACGPELTDCKDRR